MYVLDVAFVPAAACLGLTRAHAVGVFAAPTPARAPGVTAPVHAGVLYTPMKAPGRPAIVAIPDLGALSAIRGASAAAATAGSGTGAPRATPSRDCFSQVSRFLTESRASGGGERAVLLRECCCRAMWGWHGRGG